MTVDGILLEIESLKNRAEAEAEEILLAVQQIKE